LLPPAGYGAHLESEGQGKIRRGPSQQRGTFLLLTTLALSPHTKPNTGCPQRLTVDWEIHLILILERNIPQFFQMKKQI
jgi:hypothetical protein